MKIEREDAKNVKKTHVQTTAVHWILWAKTIGHVTDRFISCQL